ncbi:MAG TPA: Gmad2 immunoglobulin-like domain-containing protein [Bacillota bacterium]
MAGLQRTRTAIPAILTLSLVVSGCGSAASSGGEAEERIRELQEQVQRLQTELDAARTAAGQAGGPPGERLQGDGAAVDGTLPAGAVPAPGFRHEELDELPADVRAWADVYWASQAGVGRTFGDRTYVLVAYNQVGGPQHRVFIENVYLAPGAGEAAEAIVIANLAHVADAAHAAPVAVASIDAVDIEADRLRFDLIDRSLPRVFNAHGLPDVPLPADENVVVIEPAAGSAVPGSFSVRGYARNLFEGNLVARVIDGTGAVVLEQSTTAAACCFDWGSFDLPLQVALAPVEEFTLELGDFDMADGTWRAWLRMPLRIAP